MVLLKPYDNCIIALHLFIIDNHFETVPFPRPGEIVYKEFGSVRGFDRKGERRVGAHPPVSRPTSGPPHRPQQTSTVYTDD